MMSGVRDRSFFALGMVLAVVTRGVGGRIICQESSTGILKYMVVNEGHNYNFEGKCWVDTMNTRFGNGEKLMRSCVSNGRVSCCSVGVDTRCALLGVWGRTRIRACFFVRACPQTMSTFAHE